MIHVALLRGINVGGNNKVPMARLRQVCEALGWRDVVTYINSGNVVFDARAGRCADLAGALEAAIDAQLDVRCRVLVRTGDSVRAVAAAIPDDWTNDAVRRTDVVYLLDGVDPAQASASLQPRPGIDTVLSTDGAFVWMVARPDATRSGLLRLLASPLYQQATVRNVNTARKLAQLADR